MKLSINLFAILLIAILASLFLLGDISPVFAADEVSTPQAQTTSPPETKAPTLDRGDNAWMLTSSALVLMMTGPGLALFYCGLVRKKNVLSVMMQCVFLMCLMTVIWGLYGYTLGFGGDTATPPPKWIGNSDHLFMHGVQAEWTGRQIGNAVASPAFHPAIDAHVVSGDVFHYYPGFDLRGLCRTHEIQHDGRVHDPLGHHRLLPLMPLGMGRRNPHVWKRQCRTISAGGALDFAGGTVVHISSGVSALICALLLGKRLGYGCRTHAPA